MHDFSLIVVFQEIVKLIACVNKRCARIAHLTCIHSRLDFVNDLLIVGSDDELCEEAKYIAEFFVAPKKDG